MCVVVPEHVPIFITVDENRSYMLGCLLGIRCCRLVADGLWHHPYEWLGVVTANYLGLLMMLPY